MISFLLALFVTLIPVVSISFVLFLIVYKLYIKIRSKFDVTVNCWFCNQNARVAYLAANSWTCIQCEQYNGFTKDGDYNKDLQMSNVNLCARSSSIDEYNDLFPPPMQVNGFCNECNESQRLKIEKLSQFEPKVESRFDAELKVFKAKLEEQYRLCSTCDRHLHKVLREKKKMVLGTKFLDFILKGAEQLKQPHFTKIKAIRKQKWKRSLCILITIFTILNILCLAHTMPSLERQHFVGLLGENIARYAFLVWTHVLAFAKVSIGYILHIFNPFMDKFVLFLKTIFMMILYSMKIKVTTIAALTLPTVYTHSCPFLILGLSLAYNIIDGFKLTRFTFILTLWSVFAAGFADRELIFTQEILTLLACFTTITLAMTDNKGSSGVSSERTSDTSFHKIYCDDYDTDEDTRETISMLSQNLNCSTHSSSSTRSSTKNRSFTTSCNNEMSKILKRSPLTSSVISLNKLNRTQLSSSFRSVNVGDSKQHTASLKNFRINKPIFGSNFELSYNDRSQSSFDRINSFNSPPNMQQQQQQRQQEQQQQNGNFSTFTQDPDIDYNAIPLASPFSVSSNSIYQHRNNVLSPSRFCSNNLSMAIPASPYYPGDYLNNKTMVFGQSQPNHDISRTSSRSSGFESQIGGGDQLTSDNSVDLHSNLSNTLNSNTTTNFARCESFPQQSFLCPQNDSNFNPMQPLTINCNQEHWLNYASRKHLSNHDSFNLRKINDHLPPIQRGALLRKWKESQVCL